MKYQKLEIFIFMKLKITQEEKINILEQYVSKKLPKSIQGVAPYNDKKVMDFSKKLEDNSWFYQNKCLSKQYPNLNPTGGFANVKLSNGDTVTYQQGGLIVYTPKEQTPSDEYIKTHDIRIKTGRWWCDVNDTLKIESKPIQNQQSTIPKAQNMDDVKFGRGYIIKNMRGPVVKELQTLLIKAGYLQIEQDDSIFGNDTYNAIVKFQKDSKIEPKNNVYGIFGVKTYNALMNKLKELGK
jgi:hypothetical protein